MSDSTPDNAKANAFSTTMADQRWDYYSDQPYRVKADEKTHADADSLREYLKTFVTTVALSPAVLWRYLSIRERDDINPAKFVGLSISSRAELLDATVDLVAELGVTNLLLRIPAWESDQMDRYQRVIARFPDHSFIVNILQNADSVRDLKRWGEQVTRIIDALPEQVKTVQIANAINRSKWGCRHSGDYLDLEEHLDDVRRRHPNITFLGSSVIDFEPLVVLRTLFNFREFSSDGVAAELYVNRRGAPENRQFGFFDLGRKIRLIAAMGTLSNRFGRSLVITETNWPLLNTRPYTPNSGHPRSTVDEATQAHYLLNYYRIAWHTQLVDAVYWWQLINPGYGLVDHRGGRIRKLPSFFAFRDIVQGAFKEESRNIEHTRR